MMKDVESSKSLEVFQSIFRNNKPQSQHGPRLPQGVLPLAMKHIIVVESTPRLGGTTKSEIAREIKHVMNPNSITQTPVVATDLNVADTGKHGQEQNSHRSIA